MRLGQFSGLLFRAGCNAPFFSALSWRDGRKPSATEAINVVAAGNHNEYNTDIVLATNDSFGLEVILQNEFAPGLEPKTGWVGLGRV